MLAAPFTTSSASAMAACSRSIPVGHTWLRRTTGGSSRNADMRSTTILCGLLALFGTGAVVWQQRSMPVEGKQAGAPTVADGVNTSDLVLQLEIKSMRE